jgi:hypothetical protein
MAQDDKGKTATTRSIAVERIIADGTTRAREIAAAVLTDVKRAMKLL